jgi:hypothetical protein
MAVMSAGTYRINPFLFAVSMSGHNTFQDPQAFVDAGGSKGLAGLIRDGLVKKAGRSLQRSSNQGSNK